MEKLEFELEKRMAELERICAFPPNRADSNFIDISWIQIEECRARVLEFLDMMTAHPDAQLDIHAQYIQRYKI